MYVEKSNANRFIIYQPVIPLRINTYNVKTILGGFLLKDYIEERAVGIAEFIIENNATVRQTAKAFGVSKSTVHADGTIRNGLCG